MENIEIENLVKKLENRFFGFKAEGQSLKNGSGLEFLFFKEWTNKTKIRGVGAYHRHEIGCSFNKSHHLIEADIRRRLLPAYRDDFFKKVKELKDKEDLEKQRMLKLEALRLEIDGEIQHCHKYGRKMVQKDSLEISEYYNGNYRLSIELEFNKALNLLNIIKNLTYK